MENCETDMDVIVSLLLSDSLPLDQERPDLVLRIKACGS